MGPQVHPGFPSSSHLQVSPGVQPGVPAVWSACRDPPLDAHWRWGADRIPCAVPPPPKSTALVISLWPRSYHSTMLTFWQMAAFFRWLSKFSLDGLQLCNDSQKQWLSGMWGQICLSRIACHLWANVGQGCQSSWWYEYIYALKAQICLKGTALCPVTSSRTKCHTLL